MNNQASTSIKKRGAFFNDICAWYIDMGESQVALEAIFKKVEVEKRILGGIRGRRVQDALQDDTVKQGYEVFHFQEIWSSRGDNLEGGK